MKEKFSLSRFLMAALAAIVVGSPFAKASGEYLAKRDSGGLGNQESRVESLVEEESKPSVVYVDGNYKSSVKAESVNPVRKIEVESNLKISRFHQSPDYSRGRGGKEIDSIVLHTTEGSGVGAENWLTTKDKTPASAHYLIMENGEVVQLVKEEDAAWQCRGYNQRAIGIEFAGYHNRPLNPEQIKVGRQLIKSLTEKYNISKTNIKAHSELDPSRRKDPGKENMEAILAGMGEESTNEVSQIYSDFKYRDELPVILETAKRVGIEPELMLAIRMAENGREGLQFGVIPTKNIKKQ